MSEGRPGARIVRTGPGRFELNLPRAERLLLRRLLPDLRRLLEARDPATRRLFPPAYPDDPVKEAEYRELTGSELQAGRLSAIRAVDGTVGAKQLTADELQSWLETINSLRLVLGTRLDVSEDLPDLEPGDPEAPAYAIYEYLGWLMEQAVQAMGEDLFA